MAPSSSTSSSSPRTWRYRVFTSFHGPDVRKTFMSHLREQFNYNGILMFDDQGIKRSHIIKTELTRAIRESRISIVVLSKKYASSSWCLDELLEILKCREDIGQIVMTIFYGVDPSDVRKQTGEFGSIFDETCKEKKKEEKQKWSQALNDVGNIAGEHFQNWDNEFKMIKMIARDISNKLNTTVSKDFKDMVGIEVHLRRMQSLLHLDYEDEATIVGICGPAGIGKTTIARALHSRLSSNFQLTCFMENLRGSYNSGLDEYGLKMCLQEKLLSKILNQNGMKIHHLSAIPERLCDQKVLIILDDVDDLQQLEALANDIKWFGPGSRIIVTTEDQEILKKHDIKNTYHVDFPTEEEAHKIFRRYAFKQDSTPDNFEKFINRVTKLCSKLPLGLRVMGSALLGKTEDDWEDIIDRLENSLDPVDRAIERVLRIGYDSLQKNDQLLFLYIAFFFNYKDDDHVKAMLAENNLNVRLGLRNLTYKSLIKISTEGNIVMHKLLQEVGREAIQRQEPWKRQILIDAHEICGVLETDSGSSSVMGMSFDTSTIPNSVHINARGFKNISNLRFLSVYQTTPNEYAKVHEPEHIEFPHRLRLLHWEVYPGKCLPRTFRPEHLVELSLKNNSLEKLWEGTQLLTNLKKMSLDGSFDLKKLPDLSNATNLENLELGGCNSLAEIHSSIGNLHKLKRLQMIFCMKLQVVPSLINLASLESIDLMGCWRLRKFPDISINIIELTIIDTMLEKLPESIRLWSRLKTLNIFGSVNILPVLTGRFPGRNGADIEKIPDWIKHLHGLEILYIVGCPKLASLPELPCSLRRLKVDTCESLKTISLSLDYPIKTLGFPNCSNLGENARRDITQQPFYMEACLPGSKIPMEFDDYRAIGNSLTIRADDFLFRICLVVSPKQKMEGDYLNLLSSICINGCPVDENIDMFCIFQTEHLCLADFNLFGKDGWLEEDNEIMFEFNIDVIECGAQIFTYETDGSTDSDGSYGSSSEQVAEDNDESFYDAKNESGESNETLSDGSYKSCSENVSEDVNESPFSGSNEFDELS